LVLVVLVEQPGLAIFNKALTEAIHQYLPLCLLVAVEAVRVLTEQQKLAVLAEALQEMLLLLLVRLGKDTKVVQAVVTITVQVAAVLVL
jgi:hypothetical protein